MKNGLVMGDNTKVFNVDKCKNDKTLLIIRGPN